MRVAYVRVSSDDQNLDRQTDAMAALGVEKVYSDKASGKDTARVGLTELLSFVRDGDEVVVESISRLARSTRDLLDIVDQLNKKGVAFKSLKESLDTSTPQGRFVLTIFGALAALERETILERQAEGISSARTRGKHLGRPRLQTPANWPSVYSEWTAGVLPAVEAIKKLGIGKTSFYRLADAESKKKGILAK